VVETQDFHLVNRCSIPAVTYMRHSLLASGRLSSQTCSHVPQKSHGNVVMSEISWRGRA